MGSQFLFGPVADALGHRLMFLSATISPMLAAVLLRVAGRDADTAPR